MRHHLQSLLGRLPTVLAAVLWSGIGPALAEAPPPTTPPPFLAVARTPYRIPPLGAMTIQTDLGSVAALSGFVDQATGRLGFPGYREAAAAGLAWDAEKLVLAVSMPYPYGRKLRLDDDCFEVLLQPRRGQAAGGPVYSFTASADGTLRTERHTPATGQFHIAWQPAGLNHAAMLWDPSGIWMGAIQVPCEALGGPPREGEEWGLQVVFRYAEPAIVGLLSPTANVLDPARFARVRFDADRQLNTRCLWPDTLNVHDLFFSGIYRSSASQPVPVELQVVLTQGGKELNRKTLRQEVPAYATYQRLAAPFVLRSYPAAAGARDTVARVLVRDLATNAVMVDQAVPYWQYAPGERDWLREAFGSRFELLVGPYPSTGVFEYRVDCRTLCEARPEAATLDLAVSRDGTPLATASQALAAKAGACTGYLRLPGAAMPAGEYRIRAAIATADGKTIAERETAFVRQLMPFETATFDPLAADLVVPPFTAPRVEGNRLECVLRTYAHGPEGLLTGLLAADGELLARPAAFFAGETRLRGGAPQLEAQGQSRIAYRQTFTGAGARLDLEGTFAYDGFYRFRATLAPEGPPIELRDLHLEIPMRPEHAMLYDSPAVVWNDPERMGENMGLFPAGAGRLYSSTALSVQTFRHGNMPACFWLGDDERGLAFSCASERGMHNDDALPALVCDREADAVVLRAWFVNAPLRLAAPRRFEFALQASPFKPMPEHFRLWRSVPRHHARLGTYQANGRYQANFNRAEVYPAYGRFLDLGRLKAWSDELRRKQGFDFVPILASAQSECGGTPEALQFWHEWGNPLDYPQRNRAPLPESVRQALRASGGESDPRVMDEVISNTCPSNLRYRLWWFEQAVRHGGIDHLYQDNSPSQYFADPEAGYGYTRDDGRSEPESAIWNSRDFMQGCAQAVILAGGKESPYVWPNLASPALPGRAFCRLALVGESLQSDRLPLASIRIWASKQWGYNLQWLFQEPTGGAALRYWRALCSRLFLCDITNFHRDAEEYWRWLQALDCFWLDDPSVQWHPYYRNDTVAAVAPEGMLVSSYTATGRALHVVSNQGTADAVATIRRQPGHALPCLYDGETGEAIESDGDVFRLFVPAADYRLVLAFPQPFAYVAASRFPTQTFTAQSALDARVTLNALCEQLLRQPNLAPVPGGHRLTEAWAGAILREMSAAGAVYRDAAACAALDVGDPALRKAYLFDARQRRLLLVWYNPTDQDKLLNGNVREALQRAAGWSGHSYVLEPLRGTSYYRVLDLPAHSGKIELVYADNVDYWQARRGPFACGTQMSNLFDAVLANRLAHHETPPGRP